MGIQGSSSVTLHFRDVTGTKDTQEPITGPFSSFFAKQRPDSPDSTDVLFGSPDWLTNIIVSDQQTKLNSLVAAVSQPSDAFTSASSKRVTVQYHVRNVQTTMTNCLTIVTGTQDSPTDRVSAGDIFVLPPETVMKPGHPLFTLWAEQADKSHAIKAAPAAQKAPPASQGSTPPAAKGSVA